MKMEIYPYGDLNEEVLTPLKTGLPAWEGGLQFRLDIGKLLTKEETHEKVLAL